ncbi:hypothetical protein GMRT_10199 [Giardia muris]|uniref:Uncharacterized protein n=1 Tax=Giardia muris TaxID=5742 RepID=A0A4Z1T1D4_GIAMU|nr:hypothetical protein GMRT_10199 [Giardia muris]|eukprot:TNJ29508.1 hypothetical protein GMRT_10199 [Giardia muris]
MFGFDEPSIPATQSASTEEALFGFGDPSASGPMVPASIPPPIPNGPQPSVDPFGFEVAPPGPVAVVPSISVPPPSMQPVVEPSLTVYAQEESPLSKPTPAPIPVQPVFPSQPSQPPQPSTVVVQQAILPQARGPPMTLPGTLATYGPLPTKTQLHPSYEEAISDPSVVIHYSRDNTAARENEVKFRAFQALQDKNQEAAKAVLLRQGVEYREAFVERFRKECAANRAAQELRQEKVRQALLKKDAVSWFKIRGLARADAVGTADALRQLEAIKAKCAFDYCAHELLGK